MDNTYGDKTPLEIEQDLLRQKRIEEIPPLDTIQEESSPLTPLSPLTPSMDLTPIPEEPRPTLHEDENMDDLYDTPPPQPFSSKWIRHYMFTAAVAIGTIPVHY
jgi:hypothetical protein